MNFDLSKVTGTSDKPVPPRIVIHGEHKVGKSSFASQAPNPIFADTEEGLRYINAKSFTEGKIQSWEELLGWTKAMIDQPHDFWTYVLDSGDWAERLCIKYIAKNTTEKERSYGKDYDLWAEEFKSYLKLLDRLQKERGMAIIIICHNEIKRYEDPLGEAYDQHRIKLTKKTGKVVQEWADVIGFACIETMTKVTKGEGFTKDRARAMTSGRHILKLKSHPAYDAGNRLGLPEQIDLTWEAFEVALNAVSGTTEEKQK